MKKSRIILSLVFLLIVILELLGRLIHIPVPDYVLKPLIMIWIALFFLLFNENPRIRTKAYIAFLFSWIGDILLMFSDTNELFFFAGVGGFFVSQVFYILTFASSGEEKAKGFLRSAPLWILPFAIYLAAIYLLVYPGLEGIMKPVVFIYAVSLIGMSVFALNRKGLVGKRSFALVFAGSLLFVSSDSLLAINKFYTDLPYSGFLVMSTYIVAQYLIMQGLLSEKK